MHAVNLELANAKKWVSVASPTPAGDFYFLRKCMPLIWSSQTECISDGEKIRLIASPPAVSGLGFRV
jgi:hypothetical protein